MDAFMFTVTINAKDYDTAKDELTGSLQDAVDSEIIDEFLVEDQ